MINSVVKNFWVVKPKFYMWGPTRVPLYLRKRQPTSCIPFFAFKCIPFFAFKWPFERTKYRFCTKAIPAWAPVFPRRPSVVPSRPPVPRTSPTYILYSIFFFKFQIAIWKQKIHNIVTCMGSSIPSTTLSSSLASPCASEAAKLCIIFHFLPSNAVKFGILKAIFFS